MIRGSGDLVSIVLTAEADDQDVRPESMMGLGDEGAIRPRLTIRAGRMDLLAIRCCFAILIRFKCQSMLPVSFDSSSACFSHRNEPMQIKEHIFR